MRTAAAMLLPPLTVPIARDNSGRHLGHNCLPPSPVPPARIPSLTGISSVWCGNSYIERLPSESIISKGSMNRYCRIQQLLCDCKEEKNAVKWQDWWQGWPSSSEVAMICLAAIALCQTPDWHSCSWDVAIGWHRRPSSQGAACAKVVQKVLLNCLYSNI
jgi:hypothetical protein